MGEEKETQGDIETPETTDETPKEPETLTKEAHEAAVAKARSDALTDVGRLKAELKRSQDIAQAAVGRLTEIEEETYRRREDAARDNPDELSQIRRERNAAKKEAELKDKEIKINAGLTRVMQSHAKILSGQYNVTEETLIKYAGDDADGMEELAKSFGERKSSEEPKKTRMTEEPDDGKTKGGTKGLTREALKKMSPEEINERMSEIAEMPFFES